MEVILNLLFELILSIIAIIASRYVIPWLKEKRLYSAAKIAVEAAEQLILESNAGKEKFEQVQQWLGNKFKLSDEEMKKLIEAAVYNMNKNKVNSQ